MDNPRIVKIEWGRLEGRRPRNAGCNARLGEHGIVVRVPIARITTEDGSAGFGRGAATREQASALLGVRLDEVFSLERGTGDPWRALDFPLWDLVGKRRGVPVYRLASEVVGRRDAPSGSFSVRCYDTSLYFDDLHLASEAEAAALIAAEAHQGYERGHRAFKIKVGRGARHLPLEEGTRRDVEVVRAVREAVGSGLPLMIDANNGYNLNLAKRVLTETAECEVFWLEEPFHEDPVLYRDLKDWLARQGLATLIADGEGQASPTLLDWAREGLIDVVQYDIFGHTFTGWLATGRRLDEWGRRSAPHHYGGHYGNYAAAHLAGALSNFSFVEWDEATTPGLDTSAYQVREGTVVIPEQPGFGLDLDDDVFRRAVEAGGFEVSA